MRRYLLVVLASLLSASATWAGYTPVAVDDTVDDYGATLAVEIRLRQSM